MNNFNPFPIIKMQKNLYSFILLQSIIMTKLLQLPHPMLTLQHTHPNILTQNPLILHALHSNQSLISIIRFLTPQDLQTISQTLHHQLSPATLNIIHTFIFTNQYLNKIDRSISYFIYQHPLTSNIDQLSIKNIVRNFPQQPQTLIQNFESLFEQLQNSCMMTPSQIESIKTIVTEPDLPLPVSIRSNLGQHCTSNFQLFVCSQISSPSFSQSQNDQFPHFKNFIAQNQENYIKNIMLNSLSNSLINNIKQLYQNPNLFIETLSQTSQGLIENNHIYNFFIILLKITKTIIKSIKLRLKSLESDPYAYFTEFLLRYSLYKNYVLQIQDTLGSVIDTFKLILEDSLNFNFPHPIHQNQFSLWKILINHFACSMGQEIQKSIPIYMNLIHKIKIQTKNKIYSNSNKSLQTTIVPGMERFEESIVLEYLMNEQNIDNAQVFVSDFMEMLVDFSIDESNILLCGSSKQKLTDKHFELLEKTLVEHEVEALKQMIQKLENSDIESKSQEEFEFLERNLSVKPRTIRMIIERLEDERIKMDFEKLDNQLEETNKKRFGMTQEKNWLKNSSDSSLTQDSECNENGNDFEFDGLEYFSEVDDNEVVEIDF